MKLVCGSDIHLGRFSSVLNTNRHSTKNAWFRLIDLCNEVLPDALVLAGDILDSSETFYGVYSIFRDGISRLDPAIKVIMVAGNHDGKNLEKMCNMLNRDGVYLLGKDKSWETLNIFDVPIYGWSLDSSKYSHSPFVNYDFNNRLGIIVCHGDYKSPSGDYAPFAKDLNKINSLLTIVGHNHKSEVIKNKNNTLMSCGSVQALDFGETDKHGAYIVDIENNEVTYELYNLSSVEFVTKLEIDVSDYDINSNNLQKIFEDNLNLEDVISYRIILTGTTNYYNEIIKEVEELLKTPDFRNEVTYIDEITCNMLPYNDLNSYINREDAYGVVAKMLLSIENNTFEAEYKDFYDNAAGIIKKESGRTHFKDYLLDSRKEDLIDIIKGQLYLILNSREG